MFWSISCRDIVQAILVKSYNIFGRIFVSQYTYPLYGQFFATYKYLLNINFC